METSTVVDILNELLTAEHQSVARRLLESTVFIPRSAISGFESLQQMARDNHEHTEWLTGLILELGGEPSPRFGDPTSADLHYQDFHRVLPRLISGHEALVHKYSLAAGRVDSEPQAGELVARILARHREHADTLMKFGGQPVPNTG